MRNLSSRIDVSQVSRKLFNFFPNGYSLLPNSISCGKLPETHTRGSGMWLTVISKRNEEYRAARELQKQGATVFLPECLSSRPQKGSTASREVLAPLFPRYLFAYLDGLPVRSVLGTRGVNGIIKYGSGEPIWMRNEVMEDLMAVCGAVVDMRPEAAKFYVGQQFTINSPAYGMIPVEIKEILGNTIELGLSESNGSVKITTKRDKLVSWIAA